MGRVKEQPRKIAPAATPEAREKQMIALAVDLAEKRLLDGTAPSSVVTHYLRQASIQAELERDKLRHEILMLEAKTEALKSAARAEELYREAMEAMKVYTGNKEESV